MTVVQSIAFASRVNDLTCNSKLRESAMSYSLGCLFVVVERCTNIGIIIIGYHESSCSLQILQDESGLLMSGSFNVRKLLRRLEKRNNIEGRISCDLAASRDGSKNQFVVELIRRSNVKYLREVTPYFRKASIIQEVGWELQRGFLSATPPPPKSPPRADTRYLPLQLCRLTRAHPSSDPAVEIQSDKDANSTDTVSPLGLPTGLTPCIIPEQLHQSGTHEEPSIQTIHHRHQVTANVITYYQHNEISTASFSTIATLTLSKGRLRFDFGFGFGFGFSFAFLEEIRLEFVAKAFVFHDLTDDPADPFRDARKPFECSLVQTPVATCVC
ncbi:hypothetical protein HZH66_011385 [Vespula vulgaris]|uniref:Uncharacterized protein n=1 Tax=Vespula vulgaris TaxID=7454 RepID=A0A834JET0_VESVU|nr:hypothetical protein HZH66_011385 [Vespula vulgaris]